LNALKVAKSDGHGMVAGMLLYLFWCFADDTDICKQLIISKWFELVTCQWAKDAYWDLIDDECV